MGKQKKPQDMSLDELIEAEKMRPPLTEKEIEDQAVAIVQSELRFDGDKSSTEEDVRAAVRFVKAQNNRRTVSA